MPLFSSLSLVICALPALFFVVAVFGLRALSGGGFAGRALSITAGVRVLGVVLCRFTSFGLGGVCGGHAVRASFTHRRLTHHSSGLPTAADEFIR